VTPVLELAGVTFRRDGKQIIDGGVRNALIVKHIEIADPDPSRSEP
jgi:hypothetical protein